jgi:acyl-CoA hydrolase
MTDTRAAEVPPPRPASDSHVALARVMTLMDANAVGNVHGGVIMKEVDTAAGMAAARHAGRVCVTASIDELSFVEPVHVGDLLHVNAAVNDVGRTSLEVGVRVEAEPWGGGERRHTTSAYLVFVCIDDDGRPAPVPALVTEDAEDDRRRAQAAIRRQVRDERRRRIGAWRDA